MSEETQGVVAEPQETAEKEQTANPDREKSGLQEALLAERRKRQEAESQNKFLKEQYNNYLQQFQTKQVEEDDEDEYTKAIKKDTEQLVQERLKQTLEQQFIKQNPHIVKQNAETGKTWLEEKLEPILQKKPWLAHGIFNAENRYERALEIIEDYSPKQEPKSEENKKRLEEKNQTGQP